MVVGESRFSIHGVGNGGLGLRLWCRRRARWARTWSGREGCCADVEVMGDAAAREVGVGADLAHGSIWFISVPLCGSSFLDGWIFGS